MTIWLLGMGPNFPSRRHRVEHARDHLGRARAAHFVARLGLEQLRVRQDDPELVIEAVEQQSDVGKSIRGLPRGGVVHVYHDASLVVISPARPGSRPSVVARKRTDPPAVRTDSALPPAAPL